MQLSPAASLTKISTNAGIFSMMHLMLLSSLFRPSSPSTCSSTNSYRWNYLLFSRWHKSLSCNTSTRTLRWVTLCKFPEATVQLIWTALEQNTSWSNAKFRITACMRTWAKSTTSSVTKQVHSLKTNSSSTSGPQTALWIQISSSRCFKELSSVHL